MANPQADHFFKMSIELFEALTKIRISGEARQVFDCILRKTYGFQKKEDQISLSQFVESTGLSKNHICRAINKLLCMNLITKKEKAIPKKENGNITTYSIIKDYEEWRPLPKKRTLPKKRMTIPKKENDHTQKRENLYPKKRHTIDKIDNITIDTSTIDNNSLTRVIPDTDHARIIEYWMHLHHNRFNEKYDFKGKKDGPIIKRVLKNYGYEKSCQIMETFFNSDDDFIKKAGYTLGVFSSQINKLIQKPILVNDPMSKFSEAAQKTILAAQELLAKDRQNASE